MISYHPNTANIGLKDRYAHGFRAVDTDDVERIAIAMCGFVISPIAFRDGHRHGDNFLSANWIGLDFDEGPTLDEMTRLVCDVTHVIGTTKSHQIAKGKHPACDRFRVFLKLPRAITCAKEYKDILRFYVDRYESDTACIDAARFFWPCKQIISCWDGGDGDEYTIDIKKKEVSKGGKSYFDLSTDGTKTLPPPWVRHWLEFGAPQGQKNNTCLKIGIWLTRCGYSHQEIVDAIMQSPIPNAHDRVFDEVYKTSLNGVRIAAREMQKNVKPL